MNRIIKTTNFALLDSGSHDNAFVVGDNYIEFSKTALQGWTSSLVFFVGIPYIEVTPSTLVTLDNIIINTDFEDFSFPTGASCIETSQPAILTTAPVSIQQLLGTERNFIGGKYNLHLEDVGTIYNQSLFVGMVCTINVQLYAGNQAYFWLQFQKVETTWNIDRPVIGDSILTGG